MIKLDIAVANHRAQETWHNEQWEWSKLVKKISATHRTAETFEVYQALPKPKRDEIKDVGGFVGGYLINGKRGKGTVQHRQILTLDIDYAYADIWEDFKMYFSAAALMYSTHTHSITAPRMRLVLPLDRTVSPEEYEAIGRKVASYIGMQHFDSTGFQDERLMYWPSTAKNGVYFFQSQDGPWLSADKILSEYRNWSDMSEWPLCPNEIELVRTGLKQQDPTEKEGLIGAFCRTYGISAAIEEFLPDIYSACSQDRYTYAGGSTAAGAVVYEDKFLYSHHNTDPVGTILVNSFDLVRIHKFGHLDTDTSVSIGKRPSFQSMTALARRDVEVIREIGIFELGDDVVSQEDTDWLRRMEINGKGAYLATINNFLLILMNDKKLKDKFAYNEFDHRDYAKGKLPWGKESGIAELNDRDEAGLRHYFETTYEIYHVNKCRDAFELASRHHSFHPIREYLDGLAWDGTPRVETLFIDAFGAKDSPYLRAISKKVLVAAIARVMIPGTKFDYVVTLVGPQGYRKSTMLKELGKDWYSDTLDSVTGKEAYMQIQGTWLIEMAELSSIRRAEVESVKHFITKQEDRFRVTFGKRTENFKRQCVFFASTNEQSFLRDPTGNRRFWPVVIHKKYEDKTLNIDQLWAEAMLLYKNGEALFLSDELESEAMELQREHAELDERIGIIEKYLNMPLPADWDDMSVYQRVSYISGGEEDTNLTSQRDKVCVAEIWCEVLGNKVQDMNVHNTKFIHSLMINIPGWIKAPSTRSFRRYGNQRAYLRVSDVKVSQAILEKFDDWMN